MKVAHTSSGMTLYLNAHEAGHILNSTTKRVIVTVHPKSENEFVRLVPSKTGDGYKPSPVPVNKAYPFKIQLNPKKLKEFGSLPYFGAERVDAAIVADDVIAVRRPRMDTEPKNVNRKPKKFGASKPETVETHLNGSGLKDAIEAVNTHKDKLQGHLVLGVNEDGYLTATVEYGR